MPTAMINGTQLAYGTEGTGQPVVFVHGGLRDLRAWKHQLQALGSSYQAVALSCRHYHPDEPIAEGAALPLEALVEDLSAFLRALNLASAHLVGASSGGFVCLLLAHRASALVRTLVLVEPPVFPVLGVSIPPGHTSY